MFLDDRKVLVQVGWQHPWHTRISSKLTLMMPSAHNKFSCNLGPCDILLAEMCALLHSAKVARDPALKKSYI